MTTKSGLILAVAAGTALSSTAFAQMKDKSIPMDNARVVTPSMLHGGGYAQPRGGYDQRVDLTVYHIGIPSQTGGDFRSSGTCVYDDVTFGGPGATGPITVNGIAYGIIVPAAASPADDHLYIKVTFFPNHDGTTAAATAPPYSGTGVVWNLDIGAGWAADAGFIGYFPNPVTFTGAGAVLDSTNVFNGGPTDRTCGVKEDLYADAALTVFRDSTWQIVRRGLNTGFVVGSSDVFGWFEPADVPTTGVILTTNRSGGVGNTRGSYLALQGTGYAPPAPTVDAAHTIGCLNDGTTTKTGTVTATAVTWYTFCLNGDATDPNLKFLDIDTEGSATDVSLAVYDSTGALGTNSVDNDGGSGTNAQLSYGIGRRSAVSDGNQYDGRNFTGVAGIAAGTYYLAVAPAGTTFGNAGWSVNTSAATTSGAFNLHLNTNDNAGVLAPSVAPLIAAGDDLTTAGPLVSPGAPITTTNLSAYQVRWIKFTTCRTTTNSDTVSIDMAGTGLGGSAQTLFDSNGNLVAQSEATNQTVAAPLNFDGTTVLPAGTYYLAQTYAGRQLAPNPTTNGRWHLRATAGNNGFAFAGDVLVSWTTCGPHCGSADFNGDGDIGTDQDIEAFFACLAGNCCATCGTADFNGDGDVGTDSDIEAFFRVLAGGVC